jgi:hypothetical protein
MQSALACAPDCSILSRGVKPIHDPSRFLGMGKQRKEATMPLLIPVLVGIPVLFVGGYYIIQAWH